MSIKIFHTATRKKEVFSPVQAGKVGIYVCGITAYDVCHIGHARAAVVFDVVVRHLRSRGYAVTYVKNFTDIDDKIIARAQKEGVAFSEIAERFIDLHNQDMAALGVETPTITPRATDHMDEMIDFINILMEKGFAYAIDGDVYFAVNSFQQYGGLSGRILDEMQAGARVDINDRKKNPMDFALWKASKEGEPFWESPWGKGRPGWHIECSAMSRRYLGDNFDIHGGGEDLIFPHHENEIAQSQAASGKPLANYWMHNGFVKVNSEKMSKSLGNIFPIRDILKNYHPEVLRLFMLQSHYRSPVDYSTDSLSEARSGLIRCYTTLQQMKEIAGTSINGAMIPANDKSQRKQEDYIKRLNDYTEKFNAALDDDFNTAQGLGHVFDAVRLINNFIAAERNMIAAGNSAVLQEARKAFEHFGAVLGIFQDDPDHFFLADKELESCKRGLDIREIECLIKERQEARITRDWARADEIRSKLAGLNIVLKDSKDNTTWSIE
ncbi:MAG: cysteine--tRNA ligase [Deltaproteobacteria bacterium HGW-Deltaproteobacteria-10]|nr:MAG: cysteine--tRNA ligase [Deltaproteobacteria bacterium HGW-Deltaproteobacteria-10]